MFTAVHIAPSHRRPPHPVWVDSFSLIADLLFGNGVGRYVGAMQGPAFPQEVAVRGFSAGSFSGLAFLHILWPIPGVTTKGCLGAIACPPSMLGMSQAKAEDRLHLIHYEGDGLCCWKPGPTQLLRAISGHRSMTTLIGWRWICLQEGLHYAFCSSLGQKLPPRPNGMLPRSDLSPGSVTNLTLS